MAETKPIISLKNVWKEYSNNIALRDVSLEIHPGEFVFIVGQSGAGKSTILKMLIADELPTRGRVLVDGDDVTKIPRRFYYLLRRKIGIIFQDYKLLPKKTAEENVSFAMEASGMMSREIQENIPQILKIVGLAERADHYPHQLSGGEQQRVAIARALAHKPKIIVADEPTGNLDRINTWEIVQLLIKINKFGTTVILATHDEEVVNKVKRRVVLLDRGKLVRDNPNGRYSV